MTDRDMVRRHLALSEHHLVEGAERIAKHEALIAELAGNGRDVADAVRLLATFRAVQGEFASYRRMILEAIGKQDDRAAIG